MSEQDKNKIVNPALVKINALKAAAGKGDKTAIAELQNIRSAIHNAYVDKLAESMAAPIAAQLEAVQNEPDIIGADELFGLDPLERAEHIKARLGDIDGLSHKAALVHGQEVVQKHVAEWVRINPVSVNRGILGNLQNVTAGGPALQVANWQGETAETVPMTVTFFYYPSTLNISSFDYRPFGRVQFGSNGIITTVDVDIGLGTQFTVSGNVITLQVGLETPGGGIPATPLLPRFGGTVSFYPVVRTTPVTRTRYVDALDGGQNAIIQIPNFAKSVNFYRVPDMAATISFLGTTAIYTVVGYAPGADNAVRKFPISDDMTTIEISNTAAPGTALNVRAVFDLNL